MPTLDFKGKQFIYSHHHNVPFRELKIDKEKSLPKDDKASLDDNLIIHGDNLHALKALMPLYAGKIKCIYIDPPYNTGNEGWCYNDNVNSPLMKEWLKKNAHPVDKEDLQRHDKWLCMMYPRLKLLHELLADDGVIFVSIDDNEVHHLRTIMDEIFGEENFVSLFPRITKKAGKTTDLIAKNNDCILCFSKSNSVFLNKNSFTDDAYKHSDRHEESRGKYKLSQTLDYDSLGYVNSLDYPININEEIFYAGSIDEIAFLKRKKDNPKDGFRWRWSEELFNFGLKNDFIIIKDGKNGKRIYTKTYKNAKISKNNNDYFVEIIERQKSTSTLEFLENQFSNDNSKKEIIKIFNEKVFEYTKPSILIKKILQISTDKNSIILDSFTGSGTTAHAVLDLNKEDGGNRKFICVEMEDYANDITAERVRRVIKGVETAKDEKLKNGLGGSFTFCELGEEFNIEKILTGESLPEYKSLANYVFYTATGKSLEQEAKPRADYFIGETDLYEIYLIYQPDIAFLRSNESALNSKIVEIISAKESKKQKLVYATAKYMGQNELNEHKITFCQLPYAIHKIMAK